MSSAQAPEKSIAEENIFRLANEYVDMTRRAFEIPFERDANRGAQPSAYTRDSEARAREREYGARGNFSGRGRERKADSYVSVRSRQRHRRVGRQRRTDNGARDHGRGTEFFL
jgi:hypothetical protein